MSVYTGASDSRQHHVVNLSPPRLRTTSSATHIREGGRAARVRSLPWGKQACERAAFTTRSSAMSMTILACRSMRGAHLGSLCGGRDEVVQAHSKDHDSDGRAA